MTYQQEVDDLKSRIAKSEFDRDVWRTAGPEERYLEAYFLVEALELQLVQRIRDHAAGAAQQSHPEARPPGTPT